jgi:hypothetical protein
MRLAALILLFIASFCVGAAFRIGVATNQPTPTQPAATTTTPTDPYAEYRRRLAEYKRIPTATPGCPKTVEPGLKPFYPCLGGNP